MVRKKTVCGEISSQLNDLDNYGKNVIMNHDGEHEQVTTSVGGAVSVIVTIAILVYLVQQT